MSLTHYLLLFLLRVVFSAVPLAADPDSRKWPGEAVTVQADVEQRHYHQPPRYFEPPYHKPPSHGPPHYGHPPAEEAVGEEGYHEDPSHYKPPPRPSHYGQPPVDEAVGEEAYYNLRFPKSPQFRRPPISHKLPPYPRPPPPHYYKPPVGPGTP